MLKHPLTECQTNKAAAMLMLRCAKVYAPSVSAASLLLPLLFNSHHHCHWYHPDLEEQTEASKAAMQAELVARGRKLRKAGAIMANILAITM